MMWQLALYWEPQSEYLIAPVTERLSKYMPMIQIELAGVMETPSQAYDPSRYQYDAVEILRTLPNTSLVLYLLSVDLYVPGYRFLYGAASPGKAIVSDFRPDTVADFLKEVLHELGHALGLAHCNNNCLMHTSHSINALSKKNDEFCHECETKLWHRQNCE